uniref:Nudix hydrolase domain-containing protein n=1 Tax=Caenorhabditis tropicalis TaxID=1561998 RepID=A0A1I7UZ20_9PELO
MTEIESRFRRLQMKEEEEKSLLSNYELKTKQDQKMLARREQLLREGKELSELDEEIGVTNRMREDDWQKASEGLEKKYRFDQKSTVGGTTVEDRQIDRKLVLIVKQRLGEKKGGYSTPWILPQMKNREGETLRQTAERCIGELSGTDLSVEISGNAPFGVYTHRYPSPIAQKTGATGAKIFFYTANLSVIPKEFRVNPDDVSEFQWVNRDEFWSTVPGTQYKKAARYAFLE